MRGRPIKWTAEQLAWIEARREMPRRELHQAFVATFGCPEITQKALTGLCKRKGWFTGRDGRFPPGHATHNAGRTGYCPAGSEKGWFRKGSRNGRARENYQPIGSTRIFGGYVQRKVNDDFPLQRRWRSEQLIRWEELHGPLPDGWVLKCLDGDKLNTDPTNWEAIPRAILPRLNGRFGRGFDQAPVELRRTMLAAARLEHAAREARKGRKHTSDGGDHADHA